MSKQLKQEATRERTGKFRKILDKLEVLSMCVPQILYVFLFSYIPMVGIIIAFKKYNYQKGVFGSDWVGFKNFEFLLKSNQFARVTWNTLFNNFLQIGSSMLVAIILAILLYELTNKRTLKVVQTMLITPHFVSMVLVAYVVFALLSPSQGILNVWIEKFGGKKIDWYTKADAWPWILMITNIWKTMGMSSVTYYAVLMGMDHSLIEAAEIDGANWRQKVRYILIPHLSTLIVINLIMYIGGIFNADFGLFYNVTRNSGALYRTTDVINTFTYRTLRVIGDVGLSAATGLLQSLVGFVLVFITNWIVRKVDPERALF